MGIRPRGSLANVLHLGVKEFRSLARDRVMLVLIVWTFTAAIILPARGQPETLSRAPLAVVDEDRSELSARIVAAFYPPHFTPPGVVDVVAADRGLDDGRYTFALDIPPGFERDVRAGRAAAIQLNVDATKQSQAFVGAGYVQRIVADELAAFERAGGAAPAELVSRIRFNPTLDHGRFVAVMEIVNNITMLAIVLTGAALIREREHGTIEHLLVMPLRPSEIMLAKVWSMGLVVLLAAAFSLQFTVKGLMAIPLAGSLGLFLAGTALHLFAATAIGVFLGTVARSMPQFGLLLMLVLLPLEMLSGGTTPRESMPLAVRTLMELAPTTHFVMLAQAILYRGAGLATVWPQFLAVAAIGSAFFAAALLRFRRALGEWQR
ncbi:ABC transporter permease [Solimonas soli]|uniref:ABC transporter permease n=1 Tax=Solimonas soli TaxID=413479 RepID=UPI000484046B|nr:ABC transporter permease [Solimonas soli]